LRPLGDGEIYPGWPAAARLIDSRPPTPEPAEMPPPLSCEFQGST
jgi:hypothetical protein